MKTAADLNQDRAAVAHAARIERGIREVYAAFPDLCVNDANSNMIRHWCSQFSGVQDAVPSVPLFRAARDANREEWRKTFVLKLIADRIKERNSTRMNSCYVAMAYAVLCLEKIEGAD